MTAPGENKKYVIAYLRALNLNVETTPFFSCLCFSYSNLGNPIISSQTAFYANTLVFEDIEKANLIDLYNKPKNFEEIQ